MYAHTKQKTSKHTYIHTYIHTLSEWINIDGPFVLVWALNVSHAAEDNYTAPKAKVCLVFKACLYVCIHGYMHTYLNSRQLDASMRCTSPVL